MVKSNEFFSKNYKQSEETEKQIKVEFEKSGFKIINFDIQSEFEKCNTSCPVKVEHCGQAMPYARWVLYGQLSRPDFIIRLNKPILVEIKHKNKKYLWINERDYLDYIKWEDITTIPIYILMYVKDEATYYVHKLDLKPESLKSLITHHDGNKVFDVEAKSIKMKDIGEVIKFFKDKSL